jgi:hypothetical protein
MKACVYTLLASLVILCGCRSYTYINDVDPTETRRIDPASVSRFPKSLTVAQLFQKWGPGGAGKELIYLYRSKNDSEQIFVFAAPREAEGAWGPGEAEVIIIGVGRENGRPVILWKSEVRNSDIERMLSRHLGLN